MPDKAMTVLDLLERTLKRAPKSVAIALPDGVVTYEELDARARRVASALRFPQNPGQHLDHAVLGRMPGRQACRQAIANGADADRPVGCELLAQRQVQPHVQEWILASGLGREILQHGVFARQQGMVFGMLGDHPGNLCLERLHRQALTPFTPGFTVGGTQCIAALVGEQAHGAVLSGYSHQRAIGQCGQSGTRALQM